MIARLDQLIENFLNQRDINNSVAELCELALTAPHIVKRRAVSLRLSLCSHIDVFNQFLLALEQYSVLFEQAVIANPVNIDHFRQIYQMEMNGQNIDIDRLEMRDRKFQTSEYQFDFVSFSKRCLSQLALEHLDYTLHGVLFEEKKVHHIYSENILFWHIDNLKDQLKIVIPMEHVGAQNGAMMFINDSIKYATLPDLLKYQYKSILQNVGDATSVLNNFDSDFIRTIYPNPDSYKQLQMNVNQVAVFNSRMIHTGTINKSASRKTLTLYINLGSKRNIILSALNEG